MVNGLGLARSNNSVTGDDELEAGRLVPQMPIVIS